MDNPDFFFTSDDEEIGLPEDGNSATQAPGETKEADQMNHDGVSTLITYSEEELSNFSKRTLVADVGFLEGMCLLMDSNGDRRRLNHREQRKYRMLKSICKY